MARKKKKKRSHEAEEAPMAAMIDVTFLLLIYFITTQTEIKEESFIAINVAQPSKSKPPKELPPSIDIHVLSHGYVFQARKYENLGELESVIKSYSSAMGDVEIPVNLKLAADATQKQLIDLGDICSKYNLTKMNILFLKDAVK